MQLLRRSGLCWGALWAGLNLTAAFAGDTFQLIKKDHSPDVPNFTVRMFNTASDSARMSRVTVQVLVVYDELQFIKVGKKKFRADYEAAIILLDSSGVEVESRRWPGTAFANSFDETKSRSDIASTQSEMDLPAGEYLAKIELEDKETGRAGSQEGRVFLQDFLDQGFAVSDLIFLTSVAFLDEVPDDTLSKKSPPDSTGLYAYFEIYNVEAGDTLQINYEIKNPVGQVTQSGDKIGVGDGAVTKQTIVLNQETRALANFDAHVSITYHGETLEIGQRLKTSSKRLGQLYANLDDAIEKLEYIARGKEIKAMLALEGESKVQAFDEFWQKRDPVPETSNNEYMEEYYRRIAIANEKFRDNVKPGWRTQRGMVLIKLGAPEYISRPFRNQFDRFGSSRQRVVWHYSNLNRRVIFELIAGEYRIENYVEIFDLLGRDDILL